MFIAICGEEVIGRLPIGSEPPGNALGFFSYAVSGNAGVRKRSAFSRAIAGSFVLAWIATQLEYDDHRRERKRSKQTAVIVILRSKRCCFRNHLQSNVHNVHILVVVDIQKFNTASMGDIGPGE